MSESEASFAEMLEESLAGRQMRPGSLLTGRVVEVGPDVVMVSAGLKSDSAIPGGPVPGRVGRVDGRGRGRGWKSPSTRWRTGSARRVSPVKRRNAPRRGAASENAYESSDNVSGVISGKVKGGFTVDIDDIPAFLPRLPGRCTAGPRYLLPRGETPRVQGDQARSETQQRRGVAPRGWSRFENSAEREALLERLDEGVVMNGVVKNLTDYGAFVDLAGSTACCTSPTWPGAGSAIRPRVVNVGDEIEIKVLKYDRERNRVSLGLKQLGEDPWVSIAQRYPEGSRIAGR